jgi:hypothetical protein
MDELDALLETIRAQGVATGRLRGLLYLLIGRRISRTDGKVVSVGMTWREAAALLKRLHWDREAVRDLGLEPAELAPRDREKFWYVAISKAGLTTPAAQAEAEQLAALLQPLGYVISTSTPPSKGGPASG